MAALMTFLLIVLPIILILEMSNLYASDGFITKADSKKFMHLDVKKLKVGEFDDTILIHDPYISTTSFSILSKYYIQDHGVVPRWSRLHRKIKYYFRCAKTNRGRSVIIEPIFQKYNPERVSDIQ
jgi:hypothetical protein